jgi:hypothetical protein
MLPESLNCWCIYPARIASNDRTIQPETDSTVICFLGRDFRRYRRKPFAAGWL